MTTKMAEETRVPPKELVIPAPEIEVPEELELQAQALVDSLVAKLEKQTEDYIKRMEAVEATGPHAEIGEPVLRSGYQYWNCLTAGPFQFPFGNPPYRPSKIIAGGRPREWSLMVGLIWVNPRNGPGGSLPGSIVLGGRQFTARFESINLTDVTDGPDGVFTQTFGSPAAVVTPIHWWIPTPDPGPTPKLYEVTLTVDVTLGGQPFAAFNTWHWDPDFEPPFLGMPPVPAHWQYERPARFLLYRK